MNSTVNKNKGITHSIFLNFSVLLLSVLPLTGLPGQDTVWLEAENGDLTGVAVAMDVAGFSGTGYVTGFENNRQNVSWTFQAPPGLYQIIVGFRS